MPKRQYSSFKTPEVARYKCGGYSGKLYCELHYGLSEAKHKGPEAQEMSAVVSASLTTASNFLLDQVLFFTYVSNSSANDMQIPLNAIQLSHTRQLSPSFEAKFAEQCQTCFIMPEDEAKQRINVERGACINSFLDQNRANTLTATFFGNINANLRCGIVGGSSIEGLEAKPSYNSIILLHNP